MALIVIIDGTKVARIMPSTDESAYIGKPGVLINPVLPKCEQRDMLVDAGAIREQTAQEKQADIDAAAAVQAAFEQKLAEAAAPVTAQFEVIAVAFEDRQKRLDELLLKPDIEGLTKAVTILLGDTAQMTKLLLSFQDRFEQMARDKAATTASAKP
jgi:hypothetical protein